MERRRAPSLVIFAAASAAIHVAAFGALGKAESAMAPVFRPSAETVAGDTLDLDAPAAVDDTDEGEGETDERPAEPMPAGETAPRRPSRAAHPTVAPVASSAAGGRAATWGAVGTRYATDLATTLTRAFPQAASADPIWSEAPFGSAGEAEIVLTLDEDGRIAGTAIGGAPSPALRRGIQRTLALLSSRQFTSHGPVTKLRLVARVSRDDVHDGLHGDVFALSGGSFSGDVGAAFFALPARGVAKNGRRVDVEVRLVN